MYADITDQVFAHKIFCRIKCYCFIMYEDALIIVFFVFMHCLYSYLQLLVLMGSDIIFILLCS